MSTRKVRRILVPTDFSEPAIHAARYASWLAKRLGAAITMVYADTFLPPADFSATVGAWDESTFDELKTRARKQLSSWTQRFIDGSISTETVVRVATATDGILDQATDSGADLIVMGTHGRTGVRRLIIGSVTEGVIRRARIPVIAVPSQCGGKASMQTLVCPVTCDDQSLSALALAERIAPPDARFIVIRATPSDIVREAADLVELRSWVPETLASRCDLRLFADEHLAEQVDSFARSAQADLIVAVEKTTRATARLLYGTFAVRLVQHSECPVLTVTGPALAALEVAT